MIWLFINKYAERRCPTLCENVEYHISTPTSGKNYMEYENRSSLWVSYASPKIRVEEEYTLMGFNTMISATGGSLGLFLGLSCYGVAWKILEKVENVCTSLLYSQRKKSRRAESDIEDGFC